MRAAPTHPLPSLRTLLRGLVFLARMWASERRFRRYARRQAEHERRAARYGVLMAAEIELRARLCRRREPGRPG